MSNAADIVGENAPAATASFSKRHPAGLYVLFFSETWAQFSFFGMMAMLVYYMTKQLHFSQPDSSAIFGMYAAAAYFTPFFGGMLADRVLGQRRTVILGGTLMAIGHFMMAFEQLFFPALVFIALGNGAYIPPLTSQIGRLYRDGDPKRDQAYSIYYMGINIGAFLSPLVCGTIGELYGWHYGFAIAGVGMVIGLMVYLLGQGALPPDAMSNGRVATASQPLSKDDWAQIRSLIGVAALVILFRIAYEQSGNTIALWVDQYTDRLVQVGSSSFLVPATWFQSINPLLIFTLTPLIIIYWSRQAKRNREPATISKMVIGCFIVALAYVLMAAAAVLQGGGDAKVSWAWVTGYFVLLTLGELYVLPVGLSVVSRLAPAQTAAAMIGVWFLSKFAGNLLAGYLGSYWSSLDHTTFFLIGASSAALAGLALMIFQPFLRMAKPAQASA